MEWVIDTQGLSKTYKEVDALKSLDLRVPKHSIFGFLSPIGYLIAGLVVGVWLPVGTFLPVYTTLAASILFVVLALWIFNRQEL